MNAGYRLDDSDVTAAAPEADFSSTVSQLLQHVTSGRSEIKNGEISLIMHKAIQLAEDQTSLCKVNDLISQCPPCLVPADVSDSLGCALLRTGQFTSALANFHTAVSASEHASAAQRLRLYVHLCAAYAKLEKHRQVVRYGTQAVQLADSEVLTAAMHEDLYELYDLLTKSEQALNRFQRAKFWLKQSLRHMSSQRLMYSSPSSPTGSYSCPRHIRGNPAPRSFNEAFLHLSASKEKAINSERHSPEPVHVLFQCWRKLQADQIAKVTITEDQEKTWVVTIMDSSEQILQQRAVPSTDPWRNLQPRGIAAMVRLDSKGKLVLRALPRQSQTGEVASSVNPAKGNFLLHRVRTANLHRSTKAIPPLLFEFSPRRVLQSRHIPLLNVPRIRPKVASRRCVSGSSSPRSVQDRVVMATTRNDTKCFTIRISSAAGSEDSAETSNEDAVSSRPSL